MQATTSATANPLTKQASTADASFWSILASTTDLAKPAGWGTVAAQSATAQPSNATGTTTGTQASAAADSDAGTAASARTVTTPVVQDPLPQDQQELAAAVSTEAKAAAANATLAPTTSNAASAAGAVQRRTSDNGKSGNSSSASSVPPTVIPPTVIPTPQIQTPVQQPVTVPAPVVAGETQNAQAAAQGISASAAISAQAPQTVAADSSTAPTTDASSAQSTPQNASASAQSTPQNADVSVQQADPATKASEQVNARERANTTVSTDAKTVNHPAQATTEFAASQLQQQASKAAQEAAAAVVSADTTTRKPVQAAAVTPAPASTRQQTTTAPAATTPAGGTDAKPQSGTAKNAVAATIINVGLPQILMANTATSTTPAAAAVVSGVVPQFSALPDSANGIAKAGQNAISSTASASASTSAPTIATTNNTAANSDRSSHSSGNNDNQSQNQAATPTANATPQHTSDAAQGVPAKVVDTGAAALQSVAHSSSSAQPASDHVGDVARTAETPRMPVPVPADTETAATSGVNAAHLIQTLGQTGMQVGMHSAEFGDISIRTLVSQQQMTAQISVDHGDLGRAIAAHVATVQTKLGDEFGLHASIQVNHGGASFSGEQGSSSAGQQRSYRTPAQTGSNISISREVESTGPSVSVGDIDRLDIQA